MCPVDAFLPEGKYDRNLSTLREWSAWLVMLHDIRSDKTACVYCGISNTLLHTPVRGQKNGEAVNFSVNSFVCLFKCKGQKLFPLTNR